MTRFLTPLFFALSACGADKPSAQDSQIATDTAVGDDTAPEGCTDVWYTDTDGDGYGDPATATVSCDAPEDGVSGGGDCDDADPAVNPGATEVCNGVDDDCDGEIDESTASDASAYYTDADGDGYGDPATEAFACDPPTGSVTAGGDCDDADPAVNPDAPEICDAVDNDCDGVIDGGLGVPSSYAAIQDAIDAASDGDEICVAAGSYAEQIDFEGKALSIVGVAGSAATTLDGGGNGPVVSLASGEGPGTALTGFTITGGLASDGAGVYVDGASLALSDVVLSGNGCADTLCHGAGLWAYGADLQLTDVRIAGNSLTTGHSLESLSYGAGVYLEATEAAFQQVDVLDNAIDIGVSDLSVDAEGAGVHVTNASTLTWDRGTLSGNTIDVSEDGRGSSASGCGIYVSASTVQLSNVWVTDDAATVGSGAGYGAGIDLAADSVLSGKNLIVANNAIQGDDTALGYSIAWGGGIAVLAGAELDLENADVAYNAAEADQGKGGGVYLAPEARVVLTNTNIAGNRMGSTGLGGGIYGCDSHCLTLLDVSYTNVYGNTDPEFGTMDSFVGADGNVAVDPDYGDVSAPSALDWDLTLGIGSACIDTGDPSLTDRDGTISDIGAYGGPDADLD